MPERPPPLPRPTGNPSGAANHQHHRAPSPDQDTMSAHDEHDGWRAPRLRQNEPPTPPPRPVTPTGGSRAVPPSTLAFTPITEDNPASRTSAMPEAPEHETPLIGAARVDHRGQIEKTSGKADMRIPAATASIAAPELRDLATPLALGELECFAIVGDHRVIFARTSRRSMLVGLAEGTTNPELLFESLMRDTER